MVNEEKHYNDTVSSQIAKLSLRALEIYEIETKRCDHRTAIARALGDSLREALQILTIENSISRNVPRQIREDVNWQKYEQEKVFRTFANEIHKNNVWRVRKAFSPHEDINTYSLAILKMP